MMKACSMLSAAQLLFGCTATSVNFISDDYPTRSDARSVQCFRYGTSLERTAEDIRVKAASGWVPVYSATNTSFILGIISSTTIVCYRKTRAP